MHKCDWPHTLFYRTPFWRIACKEGTNEPHGVFGTYWHLEFDGPKNNPRPQIHMASVQCLLEHSCMIPYTVNDPFTWVNIWHPSKWPNCFQTIIPPGEEEVQHHT